MLRWLVLLCLLCLSVSAHAATPAVQMTRGSRNHLLVPMKLNGRPATFLLDSGIEVTCLQADRAAQFGVRSLGRNASIGRRELPLGAIDDLRVGDIALGPTEVALYNPAHFRGPVPGTGGKAADGLLGLDLLRRKRAIINCRTQQLFLPGNGAAAPNLAATTRALGFRRVEIFETSRGFMSVPCSIAGKPGALYIDTGAFITVLNDANVRALQLKGTASDLTARTAAGRVQPLELVQVNDLRIGDVAIPPQRFAVTNLFPDRKPVRAFTGIGRIEFYDARAFKSRREIWGLLGAELLYQHHAIIDLDSMSLYLK